MFLRSFALGAFVLTHAATDRSELHLLRNGFFVLELEKSEESRALMIGAGIVAARALLPLESGTLLPLA